MLGPGLFVSWYAVACSIYMMIEPKISQLDAYTELEASGLLVLFWRLFCGAFKW